MFSAAASASAVSVTSAGWAARRTIRRVAYSTELVSFMLEDPQLLLGLLAGHRARVPDRLEGEVDVDVAHPGDLGQRAVDGGQQHRPVGAGRGGQAHLDAHLAVADLGAVDQAELVDADVYLGVLDRGQGLPDLAESG